MQRLAWVLALGLVACGGAGSAGGVGTGGVAGANTGGTGATGTGGTAGSGALGGVGGTGATGGTSPSCDADLGGGYFLALSLNVSRKQPVVFSVSMTVTDMNGAPVTTWTLQPLEAADRTTPVGSPITWPSITHATDGSFSTDPPSMDLPPEANPLTPSAMTIDLADFSGTLCNGSVSCGTFGGEVTSPISLALDGSTWTASLVSGAVYPEPPPVDCIGTLADPAPGSN